MRTTVDGRMHLSKGLINFGKNDFVFVVLFCGVTLAYTADETECPSDDVIRNSQSNLQMGSPHRALQTVPPGYRVDWSYIRGAGMGVLTLTFIPKYTWLGEYEGIFKTSQNQSHNRYTMAYSWAAYKNKQQHHIIDAQDEAYANWLRYVNCARHVSEQNTEASQCRGKVYYRTSRDIAPGTELLTYYGKRYMEQLGINMKRYYDVTFVINRNE